MADMGLRLGRAEAPYVTFGADQPSGHDNYGEGADSWAPRACTGWPQDAGGGT